MFRGFQFALNKLLETIGIILLISLAVIVVLAVVYREIGWSLIWYDEVASVALAWLTYYGAALAALRRAHLGFPGFFLAMPLAVRRGMFIVAEVIVFGFFAVLAWTGTIVLEVMAGEALVTVRWASLAFTQSVIPVGSTLFILAEALSIPDAWRRMVQGIDVEHEVIEEAIDKAFKDAGNAS